MSSSCRRRARDDLGGPGQVRVLPREPVRGDRDRFLDEPLRLDDTIDKAELERLLRGQHLVLPQWVQDCELDGGLRPREPRRELGRSPGRDESQEALRRREVADVVGDHAVVAVQRQLDSAAEGGPIEGGHGRVRECANSSEQVMAGAAALDRLLAPLDERKLVQIGSGGEAARLAR